MKVYIVVFEVDYHNSEIEKVFATKKSAKKYVKKLNYKGSMFSGYKIEEREVHE